MREILELLERDATLSHDTIATMVGLSVEDVDAAVAEWTRTGVIRRHKAVVNWAAYDRAVDEDGRRGDSEVTAFIDVSVAPARGVGFDDVAARISRFDEVRDCYLVSGGHDLRCTVVGRTIHAVSDFVSQKLSTIDRVQSTATHFVLATHKRDGDTFADPEPDHRLPVTP
ncbi:Lrp/AsnC family transcriptional regulator [Pseudonocardia endophytica]|uniref:DNA-binding Lrp family transcriptional regulator n=1 Tax=Pseudonocardia endophytica TaxID=401976 RepID=A0A4V2PI03_PSEEN|nr:Lrp/AsnC family transcriptional regulator [Pseudonocardia endophytica]TCK22716.1 DNA-binding Lrp family transcriptional regulator [Pseudonocardia endophytica]